MPLKITVFGLWHLGCVTAACCATKFDVVGLDFDSSVTERLGKGRAPISEPGLDEAILEGLRNGTLAFTTDSAKACRDADVLWLTYDTDVREDDTSDWETVVSNLNRVIPHLREDAVILVSSQLPAGTCARLESEHPNRTFAYSPENLRLGRALNAFLNPERVIIGVRSERAKRILEELFSPFARNMIFMRTESAEMVKHALNSFLAASVAFINEIGVLCESIGADASEVTVGLKSDPRIGPGAYLKAGGPFAGGTLARDVVSLTQLAARHRQPIALIPAIRTANELHRAWTARKLNARFGNLRKRFAVLGLAYTSNTDTLRRSAALQLCAELLESGAAVSAFDPAIHELPDNHAEVRGLNVCASAIDACTGAAAVIVCTEWPDFKSLPWTEIIRAMQSPVVIDANRFVAGELKQIAGVEYYSVGRP